MRNIQAPPGVISNSIGSVFQWSGTTIKSVYSSVIHDPGMALGNGTIDVIWGVKELDASMAFGGFLGIGQGVVSMLPSVMVINAGTGYSKGQIEHVSNILEDHGVISHEVKTTTDNIGSAIVDGASMFVKPDLKFRSYKSASDLYTRSKWIKSAKYSKGLDRIGKAFYNYINIAEKSMSSNILSRMIDVYSIYKHSKNLGVTYDSSCEGNLFFPDPSPGYGSTLLY